MDAMTDDALLELLAERATGETLHAGLWLARVALPLAGPHFDGKRFRSIRTPRDSTRIRIRTTSDCGPPIPSTGTLCCALGC